MTSPLRNRSLFCPITPEILLDAAIYDDEFPKDSESLKSEKLMTEAIEKIGNSTFIKPFIVNALGNIKKLSVSIDEGTHTVKFSFPPQETSIQKAFVDNLTVVKETYYYDEYGREQKQIDCDYTRRSKVLAEFKVTFHHNKSEEAITISPKKRKSPHISSHETTTSATKKAKTPSPTDSPSTVEESITPTSSPASSPLTVSPETTQESVSPTASPTGNPLTLSPEEALFLDFVKQIESDHSKG